MKVKKKNMKYFISFMRTKQKTDDVNLTVNTAFVYFREIN